MNTLRKHLQKGSATSFAISALIVAVLILYFLYKLAVSGSFVAADEASALATEGRIQPTGTLKVGDGVPPGDRTGQQVFDKVCIQCHAADSSIADSPKISHVEEWAPRIAKGADALLQTAISGINAMPARGGGTDLTDEELARAIAYMVNQSGGNFPE